MAVAVVCSREEWCLPPPQPSRPPSACDAETSGGAAPVSASLRSSQGRVLPTRCAWVLETRTREKKVVVDGRRSMEGGGCGKWGGVVVVCREGRGGEEGGGGGGEKGGRRGRHQPVTQKFCVASLSNRTFHQKMRFGKYSNASPGLCLAGMVSIIFVTIVTENVLASLTWAATLR